MSASTDNQYLLEIGTEELPHSFLQSAPGELKTRVEQMLEAQGIAHGTVQIFATPRRLALLIEALPEEQAARAEQIKGPPTRIALTADGQPTPAGLGFAKKLGVDFNALRPDTIDGETYLTLTQTHPGRSIRELLAAAMPDVVLGLSGSHFMAWGSYTVRFSRPIRWLVSLWNETHLPVTIGPVTSGVESRGHRVLSQTPITISSPKRYLDELLSQGSVLADPVARKAKIAEQLKVAAQNAGGQLVENKDLLDVVTMLVEHPSVVVGSFQERFLEIPEEVTITVMTNHQKYFPVRDAQGKLRPSFMTISNGLENSADNIRHGNEKVLTARLEDARFFFADDQKISLEDRLEALKGITFQKGLGSMFEKAKRLELLSSKVSDALGYDATAQADIRRAARLAKADLVTGMVFEFTELQGAMGRTYAKLGGESTAVSEAIYEHYLPRFLGDDVAQSPTGIAVSLADKIDTIAAVFSQKNAKLPSGSKDPLGLRRMASGIIQTVLSNALTIDLDALFRAAYQQLVTTVVIPEPKNEKEKAKGSPFQDEDTTLELVTAFVLQRFRGILLEQDTRYDLIDAAFDASGKPLSNLLDSVNRIAALKILCANADQLKALYEPANRIGKILGGKYDATASASSITESAFRDPSENALWQQAQSVLPMDGSTDYDALVKALSGIAGSVEAFFEKVMVNDSDDAVRKNRYNLLSVLNRLYLQVACFSRLVV